MSHTKHVPFAVAAALSLLFAGSAFATEDLAESSGLACTACHDKEGSKRLNDQGKYFELMRSMDGYADLEASFGKCTFCHRRKPGSKKLTRAGKGFANALDNMEALVEWVKVRHPGWPRAGEVRLLEPGEAEKADPGEGDGTEPSGLHPAR